MVNRSRSEIYFNRDNHAIHEVFMERKHIDVPMFWCLAACNGRQYVGRWSRSGNQDKRREETVMVDFAGHAIPNEALLDPIYEMVILNTPRGPERRLEYPFFHASIKRMTLPSPTLVMLDELWDAELDFYEAAIEQAEANREKARAKAFKIKLIT